MSGHRITADLQKADFDQADPGTGGTITAAGNWTVVELISAADEWTDAALHRTLADPVKSGQVIVLTLKTDGGELGVTGASAINTTPHTKIRFTDPGDTVVLTSVPNGTSGYRWIITANDTAATS